MRVRVDRRSPWQPYMGWWRGVMMVKTWIVVLMQFVVIA